MRIAQVAPPFVTVPPTRYGGTERVVATLTEELVRRGHEVTLFASGDSRTSARLVPIGEQAVWHREPPYTVIAPFWTLTLDRLARELDRFDLVHSHLGHYAFPLARLAPCPIVSTLHGALDRPELERLYADVHDAPVVSISDAQRQPLPRANWVATVYHGLELDRFTFSPRRGSYFAFIGRIAPEKGVDTAIRVAQRVGLPILIAARKPLPFTHDPSVRRDWEYYEREI
jgi:glycosyltransferase involved in cell wall biosynthesis